MVSSFGKVKIDAATKKRKCRLFLFGACALFRIQKNTGHEELPTFGSAQEGLSLGLEAGSKRK
jgi:hypothetical protein